MATRTKMIHFGVLAILFVGCQQYYKACKISSLYLSFVILMCGLYQSVKCFC